MGGWRRPSTAAAALAFRIWKPPSPSPSPPITFIHTLALALAHTLIGIHTVLAHSGHGSHPGYLGLQAAASEVLYMSTIADSQPEEVTFTIAQFAIPKEFKQAQNYIKIMLPLTFPMVMFMQFQACLSGVAIETERGIRTALQVR